MKPTAAILFSSVLAVFLLGLLGVMGQAHAEPLATPPSREVVRGIIVSTHTDGRDWARAAIVPTFRQIRELGAGWVAIHPYAAIRADGSLRFRRFDPTDPPEHIARPIREAHALGLKILIKPHLAYWGSPFRWRGEIDFDESGSWERFWRDYEAWILLLAAASREADGFVVGTELDRTLRFESEWRELIAGVRERTAAALTYGANWTDYTRVPFWDALDVIGVQAYFPVAEREGAGQEEIRRGWAGRMGELRAYALRHNRAVVFTELGYNRAFRAPLRPWDDHSDGEEALPVQERCLSEALRAVAGEPWVAGAFLWKWFPEPHPVGHSFQLASPELRRVIREAWGS